MFFGNGCGAACGKLLVVVTCFFLANALDASGNLCAQVLGRFAGVSRGVFAGPFAGSQQQQDGQDEGRAHGRLRGRTRGV